MNVLYTIVVYPIELLIGLLFTAVNSGLGDPASAIAVVSLTVNLLVLPLYRRSDALQEEERRKQASMTRWVEHIKRTFTGDERFMMLSAYYRQQNYKPVYALRGSLSLLLQIPFFIAAYRFLSGAEALYGASLWKIPDLSRPDGLLQLGERSVNALPLLMTFINLLSGAVYTKGHSGKEKLQLFVTALVFLALLYDSPSGLVFYWTLNNLFSLGKNVIVRLPPKAKKVGALTISLGALALCPILLFGWVSDGSGVIRVLEFFTIAQIPLFRVLKRETEGELPLPEAARGIFPLNMLLQTLLPGLLTASAVIASEPQDFLRVGPAALIGHNLCLFAGFFLVWCDVFYFLADERGKKTLSVLAVGTSLTFLANYLLFGERYGIMSTLLVFEETVEFSEIEYYGSLALMGLLFLLALFLVLSLPGLGKNLSRILLIGVAVLSFVNCRQIRETVKPLEEELRAEAGESVTDEENLLHLSRDGNNVIVLMLDRAVSGYLPYMFAEEPRLQKAFKGFTYYPDTVSFGRYTNFGTPPLFGGYEYTPEEMNRRSGESLAVKHNEALKLMPSLFSQHGFQVTVVDPPYAGYKSPSDLSIYRDIDNVRALNYAGKFNDVYDRYLDDAFGDVQEHSLFGYCVLRMLPVPLREGWYHEGDYHGFISLRSFSSSDSFLDYYGYLPMLPELTEVEDNSADTLLIMDNEATHFPTYLDVFTYEPSSELDERDTSPQTRKAPGLPEIRLSTELEITTYEVCMATFLKLADWFDYLREEDVFDNTRIIIVSDHGANCMNQFENMVFRGGKILAEQFQSLLLVKDFNSRKYAESDEFMTVADVPTLAVKGLIDNPVNPYTGNPITDSGKTAHPQMITGSRRWQIGLHTGAAFRTDDDYWYSVHDSIFREENWEIVGKG